MPDRTYLIEIDRELCMGSGVCESYASHTFAIDEETKSTVVDRVGDDLEVIKNAVAGCPTSAITLSFPDSSQQT